MADDDGYEQGDEDNLNYKSISCERIPELFLDKLVAKKHFSKFGKINRFILRPNRLCCTVDYETEQDAANAYENAGNFNGHEFIINYAEKEVGHVQNTEEWVDPDVQAELDAMGQRSHKTPSTHLRSGFMKPPMQLRSVKPLAPKAVVKSAPPAQPIAEQLPLAPKVAANVRMELEALLRKPAYTDEEKYRVLDARDKLIRLTTVRQTDIKKAVSAKGTCPDMCPEKERLMREFQRQIATFEMSNATGVNSNINHRRAIKEYSRSSADQEVPLGHELRAENVLQMTMLYLMSCIMDLCDDAQTSLADWFHFVWDRTRSIRKDITQQELCSLGAVELVEQCARFHIHCAARLVAEDPSVFDRKINAENLTKCLQTLKYMYHDLRIKNVRCPCEAEFRGYIVLLNLGDANFLWELKQLPKEIQQSADIKRAIAFYNALQNNNYVRFFTMIRKPETPYLSACILLGYFTKLRLKAMEAIVKSHTWRKNPAWLPIPYLMRVLGFESVEAAVDFFSAHGLQCVEARVKLDRLSAPDLEYSMDREIMLVESKRQVSVGECVCGHQLGSTAILDNHQPHNSFDSNGLLKPEAWNADDQLRGEAAAVAAVARRSKQLEQQQQQPRTFQQPSQSQMTSNICAADNVFKIPVATPLRQQQLQPNHQQLEQKSAKQPVPSIFGGNQFGRETTKTGSTTSSIFASSAAPSKPIDATGLFGSVVSTTSGRAESSGSLFKIPLASGSTAEKPIDASSASAFFNTRFTPNANETKEIARAGGIFGSFAKTNQPTTLSPSTGSNIFGAAAKETVNIFQQQQQQQPKPMPTDNIFKHFQTTPSVFEKPSSNIFGAAAATTVGFPTSSNVLPASTNSDFAAKPTLAETLARKRELEEQERQKLAELEEEREKLRLLEEQRERQRKEVKRQRMLDAFHERAARESLTIYEQLLAEKIRELSASELDRVKKIERQSLELTSQLLDETVRAQVEAIQNEEYALMCHDQMILQRYFERWLQATRKKLAQRQLLETTPIWAVSETRAEQSQQLEHPKQAENLKMIKRYRLGMPCDFKQLLSPLFQGVHQTVNIFQLISQYFKRKHSLRSGFVQQQKYFKLLLTLPGDCEELSGFEGMCNRWLHKYLRLKHQPTTDHCCVNGVINDVALCVRKLTGMLPVNEAGQRVRGHECNNADAIICFMTGNNLRNTRRRLHHLLKLSKLYKPVAISLVVYNPNIDDERMLEHSLELNSFIAEGRVSSFSIYGSRESKKNFNFYGNLKRAIRFVARESSFNNAESEALEMQKLHSWLEAALGEAMWQRWQDSVAQNPIFNKICRMPHFVVALYNESLQRLKEIVAEDFEEAPEFPEELHQFVSPQPYDIPLGLEHFPPDWKSKERGAKLVKLLNSLRLPVLAEDQMTIAGEINDVELALLNYASSCIPQDDMASTQAAYEAIKNMIEQLNNLDLLDLELHSRLSAICWLQVVKPIVYSRINHVLGQSSLVHPTEVIYRRQSFNDYQQLPWWFNFAPLLAVTVDYSEPTDVSTDAAINEDPSAHFVSIIEQAEITARKAEENLLKLRQKSSNLLNDELTRALDENFYQFELAKNCGSYTTILPDYDDDEEDELERIVPKKYSPQGKKRKMEDQSNSEVDEVMAKAFALIEKFESQEDYSAKRAHKQSRTMLLEKL